MKERNEGKLIKQKKYSLKEKKKINKNTYHLKIFEK